MGWPTVPCDIVPAQRQIVFGTCYLPITWSSERSLGSRGSAGDGLCCNTAPLYHSWWYWSPPLSPTLNTEQEAAFSLLLASLLGNAFPTEVFLHNSVTVCLLQVEGKLLWPKGSCNFDMNNSLHKRGSTWAWSKLAPEEHHCWLILHMLLANLNILSKNFIGYPHETNVWNLMAKNTVSKGILIIIYYYIYMVFFKNYWDCTGTPLDPFSSEGNSNFSSFAQQQYQRVGRWKYPWSVAQNICLVGNCCI